MLSTRFPNPCKLELGVDVLEFLPPSRTFETAFYGYLNNPVSPRGFLSELVLHDMLRLLQTHPNIGKLHIELVWSTFLEDREDGPESYEPAIFSLMNFNRRAPLVEDLRGQLRDRTMELVQTFLPMATVTGRVSPDE